LAIGIDLLSLYLYLSSDWGEQCLTDGTIHRGKFGSIQVGLGAGTSMQFAGAGRRSTRLSAVARAVFSPRTRAAKINRLDRHTSKVGQLSVGEYLREAKTIPNFQEKLLRLYEQARHAKTHTRSEQEAWSGNDKSKNINTAIEIYARRWLAWAVGI